MKLRESTARHGTRSRYTAGCRCADCRRANNDYTREWARQRYGHRPRSKAVAIEAEPHRRVCLAIGATLRRDPVELLVAAGMRRSVASHFIRGHFNHIGAETAATVRSLIALLPSEAEPEEVTA